MLALHSQADAALKESADSTISALAIATALQSPSYVPANSAVYPGTNLGTALKDVARMIKGNTKIRVATIDEGDWDMHSGLGTYDNGWMYGNLLDLGKAINAFVTDLGSGMDNVTLVTISEFGRRAQENDSQGVDHGWGNAMMVFSNNVNTAVHGVWPGLADDKLTDGDLTATTDYRKVLADILYNRCGSSVSEVTSVFPGFSGSSMGVMKPLP